MFNFYELPDNIKSFVDKLGIKKAHVISDELWALCPFHDDKIPDDFSINLHSGKFYCFACKAQGGVIGFINNKGYDYNESNKLWHSIKLDNNNEEIKLPPEEIPNFMIDMYIKNGMSTIALNRSNWDYETLHKYHVCSDSENNPVFFITDLTRKKVSIMVKIGKADYPIMGNYWKEYGLFGGLDLLDTDKIVVVEGLWDAVYIHGITKYKTLFLGGTKITDKQIETLKRYKNCYFMLDGDASGRQCRDYIHSKMGDSFWRTYYCGGYNNDPDQMTPEQVKEIMDKAKSWEDYQLLIKSRNR